VVDYDDAVFHNYDQHSLGMIRYWMGDKIDWVMRNAQMVFVGNPYLGDRALQAGAKQIQLLPTVINPDRYQRKEFTTSEKVRIGWIGSPTTIKYLEDLKPVFQELQKTHDFELVIINSKAAEWSPMDFEVSWIPWTEETEVASIRSMDIGIMPLSDNLWERGKCAYKLIQYMACGLPVVASPIGMNEEVVTAGENGYLAKDEKDWISYLGMLIEDATLRKKLGDNGYQLVSEKYTLNKNFEIMEAAVKKLKETH
jgi:glycosyltransferase involved in cell wall biosynthesis